ncbi:hypothetical protein B4Q04_20215 [Zobellia sp. OII3]|uniref:hypothetical protein n=1 Tax=Zobellia sp. OII3 TaxID=2034520 RepID=UPI000B538114|nr:hypothetical protein [Zobellia sp. OII3]OWW23525.1 hypothetical protein B4Q04_20215 [Zobellia sp. OII3]
MLNEIGTYLYEGSTLSALEVYESEGKETYALLVLKKSKGELLIVHAEKSIELKSLKNYTKKNSPLFLILNTSSVLTKQVETLDSVSPEAIVNHTFPNLSMDAFYFEIIQERNEPIVSISKKEYVHGILETLNASGFVITGFSLGISSISSILTYFQQEKIGISNAVLSLENRFISQIDISPLENVKIYNVNGIELKSEHLLAFAQILRHLEATPSISNFRDFIEVLSSESGNRRIFEKISKLSIIFFLVLLSVNFLIFSHYQNALEKQIANIEVSVSQRQELQRLEQAVQQKQEREEIFSTSSNSKSTYYLDQLAKGVPSTVLMSKIVYQPLLKPVRDTKPIQLDYKNILVYGVSENHNDFSEWLVHLEKYEWTTRVETMDYDYLNGGKSNFSVKIGIYEN